MILWVFLTILYDQVEQIDTLERTFELDTVYVTASRYKIDVFHLPFNVSIIPRNDYPLSERLLRTCGGTLIDYGNLSSLSIHGSTSEQVGVSINGTEINMPQNGTFDLSLIPGYFIGEGYVISSSSAGMQQTGGRANTVAFYTKKDEKSIIFSNGSFRKYEFGIIYPLSFVTTGFHLENSDNRYPFKDEFGRIFYQENAGYKHLSNYLLVNLPVRMSLFSTYRDAEIPDKLGSISGRPHKKEGLISASLLYDKSNLRLFGSSNYYKLNFSDTIFGSDTHRNLFINIEGAYKLRNKELGLKIKDEYVSSTKIGDNRRLIMGIFFFEHINLSEILSTPSVMCEYSFQKLYNLSFILPFSHPLKERWRAFYNLSLGYRYPTMNELYWPEDNFSAGNPDLKSETNFTIESGLRHISWYFLKSCIFYRVGQRVIVWQPGADGKWRPANAAKFLAVGGECEFFFELLLKINTGYNFLFGRIDDGVLPYRPAHSLNLSLEKYGIYMESVLLLKRPANPSGIVYLKDIFLINFGYQLNKRINRFILQINPVIKNILDKNFEFIEGYPQPGRRYEITIKMKEV
jgi:hypothetical protein